MTPKLQTQNRVNEGFIGYDSYQMKRVGVGKIQPTHDHLQPFSLTGVEDDWGKKIRQTINFNPESSNVPVIMVIKKNTRILADLLDWLKTGEDRDQYRNNYPLLLIDDEADNASLNTTKDKKIVMPYYKDGKSESEIAEIIGKSVERVEKIIRRIKGVKKKETCREYFEKGKSEDEAVSATGFTLARVKRIYDRCRKKKGLDVTTPTSPKSSDQILSINGETSFQIKCKSCDKVKNGKIFLVDHSRTSESGILQAGFNLDADRCDECNEKVDVKFISDDMAS